MTHHQVKHLGRRNFVCSQSDCGRAFGYKHLLQRHTVKVHDSGAHEHTSGEEETNADSTLSQLEIDYITGKAYADRSQKRLSAKARLLSCPYPFLNDLLPGLPSPEAGGRKCEYTFGRAYDFRRHLASEHKVHVEKTVLDCWVQKNRHH